MPKSSSSNRRPNKGPHRNAKDDTLHRDLQRLIVLNEAETLRMVPSVPDVPRMVLNKDRVFTATFSYNGGNIVSTSAAPTNGALTFILSSVPGYTSWTTSFDSYRIVRAYAEFVPFGITASANATLGQITTAIDYDDSLAMDQAALLQYDTAMLVESARYFERRLVPRAAKALYSGTAFTSYGQDTMAWIDCDSASVPHYGIKYSQGLSSTANTGYTALITLVVNFRNNN